MDGDGFKRVSDDKSVDISKLPEDDKGLYYKDEPYTTKKLQQRLIITYSPKYALYQKSIRSKQIERAQAMLDSGNTKRTAGTQTIQPDLLEQQQLPNIYSSIFSQGNDRSLMPENRSENVL